MLTPTYKTGRKASAMYVLNFWHTVTDYGEWKRSSIPTPSDARPPAYAE